MAAIGGIGSGGRVAALEQQKTQLVKQYCDTAACNTTPDAEKHRQETQLDQQIGALSAQIAQAQQSTPAQQQVAPSSPAGPGQYIDIKV